jgi:hypothetical protein
MDGRFRTMEVETFPTAIGKRWQLRAAAMIETCGEKKNVALAGFGGCKFTERGLPSNLLSPELREW